ncbi:MAG: 2-C-methyl-D-erythritol 4-phosphate cytidylyltransferase [Dehalococcoidia bacterium]|nr:2-C-methyl-D-erythritol 4-phosphate cytidylyltransferase [Dehalococcoidia bacterium]
MSRDKAAAIVVAAGQSQRMEGTDKILASLGGRPVITWSLDALETCPSIGQIVLVLNSNNLPAGQELMASKRWPKLSGVCLGGIRRQDSVKAGLALVKDFSWVVVHDGARPFISSRLIEGVLEAAHDTGAAIAAIPARDTIKLARKKDATVSRTIPRERVWLAQTPQVFSYNIIRRAYEIETGDVTDDASLVERLGIKVKLYYGSHWNIKITTPEDLELARVIMAKAGLEAW